MIFTLFIHVHKFPIKHMCWHSITKIHRNGPRAHFPFSGTPDSPVRQTRAHFGCLLLSLFEPIIGLFIGLL
jgi:hypothetical protein